MITLTAEERLKFARWLRQEAHASEGIASQMAKMGAPQKIMADHLAAEAVAFKMIARKLENTEEQTIG